MRLSQNTRIQAEEEHEWTNHDAFLVFVKPVHMSITHCGLVAMAKPHNQQTQNALTQKTRTYTSAHIHPHPQSSSSSSSSSSLVVASVERRQFQAVPGD